MQFVPRVAVAPSTSARRASSAAMRRSNVCSEAMRHPNLYLPGSGEPMEDHDPLVQFQAGAAEVRAARLIAELR